MRAKKKDFFLQRERIINLLGFDSMKMKTKFMKLFVF